MVKSNPNHGKFNGFWTNKLMVMIYLTNNGHFFVIKPTRRTNFSNLFWNEILHVSDSCSVHHQELFSVHSAMVYVIQVLESCLQTYGTYTVADCTVNNSWWWTEKLSETCRVSFQNKFEKLVRLVGFITKKFVTTHGHMSRRTVTCQDARSNERKKITDSLDLLIVIVVIYQWHVLCSIKCDHHYHWCI
jgi:hypothetical protein